MNYSLETLLKHYDPKENYEFDYNKKINEKIYNPLLDQIDIKDILDYLDSNKYIDELIKEIKSVNKEILYKSFTHGYFHNERVITIGFIIAKLRNIDSNMMKILMDACKYHDIGRVNDAWDESHGEASAELIDKVVQNDSFYDNDENLKVLKSIIEYHSKNDNLIDLILDKYNVKDRERTKEIMKILKDADGLDRVRLSMRDDYSELDPSYLRTKESKSLIKFSHQLNELYLKSLEKIIGIEQIKLLNNPKLYQKFLTNGI